MQGVFREKPMKTKNIYQPGGDELFFAHTSGFEVKDFDVAHRLKNIFR